MAEINAKMVNFESNGHTTPGYLATPAGEGPFPALIVLQEWWGLVGHIKEVAERFATAGYLALAPDLYYGQSASEPDEARKLAMALDRQRAVAEIGAAAAYLASLDIVSPKQVGVLGFCMGGGLALSAAASLPNIGAVVAFYGRPLEASDTAKIQAPVLGLYGEEDHGIPVSLVNAFEKELEANRIPHHIHLYAGAQHAFFNDERPAYHPEASEDAWKRALAWLGQHLGN